MCSWYSGFLGVETFDKSLPHLITAASLIFSITVGFLITKHFRIKEFRREMLNRFVELQSELQKYRRAFQFIHLQFANDQKVDPQTSRKYTELAGDRKFWQDDSKKPTASMLIRDIYEFSSGPVFEDFEKTRKIISKSHLEHLHKVIGDANALLTKTGTERAIAKDLGFPDAELGEITFADKRFGLDVLAGQISTDEEKEYWETLDFWYIKIIEATSLTEKMLSLSKDIHDYKGEKFKKLMNYLIALSVFGIVIPLGITSFNYIEEIRIFFSMLAFIGAFIFFVILIREIYLEITSKAIYDL